MYKAFIEPDLQTAHIKIINKFNPFTGFQNPIYILKVVGHNFLLSSNLHFNHFELSDVFVLLTLALRVYSYCSQQGL